MYLLVGRSRFWRIEPFFLTDRTTTAQPSVAVVIPARDEAASVAQVVASWKAQRYDGELRVCLIDDHSSDGTFEIAQRAIGDSPRFRLLRAPERPDGWTGKLWAVSQGVAATTADYILFTDADIVHAPETLQSLLAQAERGYDLISLMVRLRCESLAERALIPAFVFFFFLLYPPRSRAVGAAGGCLLVRRTVLERAGGIASIRGALIDDCALARAVQRSGGRVFLAPADQSYSLRASETFGHIERMIARTAFTQLGYSPVLLAGTLVGLCVTYLAPPLLAVFARGPAQIAGILAWLLMSAAYAPTVRYYRISPLWSIALPAIALFYSAATVDSAIRYWQGRGGEWKGRAQAGSSYPGNS